MTADTDDPVDAGSDAQNVTDAAAEAAIDEAPVRWFDRIPWQYIVPVVIIGSIWIGIGFVCSPNDFRF